MVKEPIQINKTTRIRMRQEILRIASNNSRTGALRIIKMVEVFFSSLSRDVLAVFPSPNKKLQFKSSLSSQELRGQPSLVSARRPQEPLTLRIRNYKQSLHLLQERTLVAIVQWSPRLTLLLHRKVHLALTTAVLMMRACLRETRKLMNG